MQGEEKKDRARVRKKRSADEDDTNIFGIMFILISAEQPLTLSEISKKVEIPTNLVFYYLKKLKKDSIIVENENKCYSCQPFFKDEDMIEDIDSLLIIIIKILAKNIDTEVTGEKKVFRAVLANLRMYLGMFELEAD